MFDPDSSPPLSSDQNLQDWAPDEVLIMSGIANSVLWLLGILVLSAVLLGLRHRFSADAREARRRARSHGPVVSRKHGPSVRLAVDVDKPKRRRKR
jgi:hypothetical protein